jgi:hypothetical protein
MNSFASELFQERRTLMAGELRNMTTFQSAMKFIWP